LKKISTQNKVLRIDAEFYGNSNITCLSTQHLANFENVETKLIIGTMLPLGSLFLGSIDFLQRYLCDMISWNNVRGGSITVANSSRLPTNRIPVILDTDIGSDIDDTWALAMMLNSPELDVRLVTTATGDTTERAKITAKMLEIADRTDIPIGIGIQTEHNLSSQTRWVEDYDLTQYSGIVYDNAVDAMITTIKESPQPVTIVAIGPLTNVAAAIAREPEIVKRAQFVGMHGSIYRGYGGSKNISVEYNVACDIHACQKVLGAGWNMTITPLDTCGLVQLKGQKYNAVCSSPAPLARAVIENYRMWSGRTTPEASSILFDTVAVYLAFADELLTMEQLRIRVTDDGYTVIDDKGELINCAVDWKDMSAFEDLVVKRITSE
jgi:inosine-uridine nucleoside N-ribohydrolase